MPRTVQDILDHGDGLAKRFEDYEPRPGDERPAETFAALRRAVLERAKVEGGLQEAIARARGDGCSWRAIGSLIGTSGEAVRQRYGTKPLWNQARRLTRPKTPRIAAIHRGDSPEDGGRHRSPCGQLSVVGGGVPPGREHRSVSVRRESWPHCSSVTPGVDRRSGLTAQRDALTRLGVDLGVHMDHG